MNINEEEVDLGLALGSTYYSARTRLKSTSGAGVNADSRVDMAFASSDPLSELVWSPHNGLSLKCSGSGLSNKKPLHLWNVGLSLKDSGDEKVADEEQLIISHATLEADDKLVDNAYMLKPSGGSSNCELQTSHRHSDAGCKLKLGEEGEIAGAIEEDNCKLYGKEGQISSHNGVIADIVECSKKNAEQDTLADEEVSIEMKREFSCKIPKRTGCNPRFEFGGSSNDIVGPNVHLNSEPHAEKLCEAPICSLPKLVCRPEPDDEVTSSSRGIDTDKARKSIAIPAPNLAEMESSAENDLGDLATKEDHNSVETRLQRENSCPMEKYPSYSRIHLYQEKGKEKALSDGDMYRRSDDEDDSNDSMESCNSAGLISKGIKRQSYYEEQLVGSKRLKKQMQACQGSSPLVRTDSSFINWISNMVKGLSDSNKEGSSSLSLTLAHSNDACGNNNQDDIMCNKPQDCESPKVGFQSMFQSLYSRNTKIPILGIQKDNCSIDESRALVVTDKKSPENTLQLCNKDIDNPCKQIILCNKEANRQVSRNIDGELFSTNFGCAPSASEMSSGENKALFFPAFSRAKIDTARFDSLFRGVNSNAEDGANLDTPLPLRCMPSKSSPLSSLWITRLYSKASKLENCDQVTEETPVFSSEFLKSSDPEPFSEKPRTPEAMSSVFAKRLDAFRHILPVSDVKPSTCKQICFFCGRSSHDLHTCPNLTETELDDLLLKISEFDMVEESPSFCIKCFQFDHWASSCPSVPGPSQQKVRARHHNSFRVQLHPLDDHGEEDDCQHVYTRCTAANGESSRRRLSTSNEFQRSTASNSDDDLKSIQRFPLLNFISVQNTVAEGEMFQVITKLRLSRADVLRWMNSNVSLSHLNGFFLRLRLGSSETGLTGTGYYAARITGDKTENISCTSTSKKSILVDVGGIQSSVGSQYVSNQDFVEDEIKAWWSRIVKTGGSIPSMDELNSKFKERKDLGF